MQPPRSIGKIVHTTFAVLLLLSTNVATIFANEVPPPCGCCEVSQCETTNTAETLGELPCDCSVESSTTLPLPAQARCASGVTVYTIAHPKLLQNLTETQFPSARQYAHALSPHANNSPPCYLLFGALLR